MTRLPLTAGLVLTWCASAAALPPGSDGARRAIALCEQADGPGADDRRVEILTRGVTLAEAALAADDRDALAHFALFCNLGRRVRESGLPFTRPLEMLRAVRALDRAVELAPADPDVLTAKGALLIELPRVFGGDVARGEEWLRRALAVDPQHQVARAYLAEFSAE